MVNAYLESIRKKVSKVGTADVEVYHVERGTGDFIESYLSKLEEQGKGRFSKQRNHRNSTQYQCERAHKSRRGKTGDVSAIHTRANSCKAYVSFKFMESNGRRACVVRQQLVHANHDLNDPNERKVERIHPQLASHVQEWIKEGRTLSEILVAVACWSGSQGHHDFRERRFYPSYLDMKYLKYKVSSVTESEEDEKVIRRIEKVNDLLAGPLKEHVAYVGSPHGECNATKEIPAVILLQTKFHRDIVQKYGQQLCLIVNSTKEETQSMNFGYNTHILTVHNEHGQAMPAGCIVSTTDQSEALLPCFAAFKQLNPAFSPRAFVVDPNYSPNEVLTTVWPQSSLIYCWFHVVQAVTNWVKEVTPTDDQLKACNQVLNMLKHLHQCKSEVEFQHAASKINRFPDLARFNMSTYLQVQWLSVADRWAYYGRPYLLEDPHTNGNVERLYLYLKHRTLYRINNRPLSNLLGLLTEDGLLDYFSYMTSLRQAGRLQHKEAMQEAEKYLNSDKDQQMILDETSAVADIRIEQTVNQVHLSGLQCDCKAAIKTDLCFHVYMALTAAEQHGIDLEKAREALAKKCVESRCYVRTKNQLIVLNPITKTVSYTDINTDFCTCVAFANGVQCFCMKFAKDFLPEADDAEEAVEEDQESTYVITTNMDEDEEPEEEPSTQKMLHELFTWSNSAEFRDTSQLREVVQQAHALALGATSSQAEYAEVPAISAVGSDNVIVQEHCYIVNAPDPQEQGSQLQEQYPTVQTISIPGWVSM